MSNHLQLGKLWFFCGILLLLLVAVLSLTPVPVEGPDNFDKLAHLLIYAFLSGWFSLLATKPADLRWSFSLLVIYGVLLEVLQGMTDYRSFEVADAIANTIGAALGVTVYFTRLRFALVNIDQRLAGLR